MERRLRDQAYVHRHFEDVCRLFETCPERVIEPAGAVAAARAGREETDAVVAHVHVGLGGFEVVRDVDLVIEDFDRHDQMARLSFRWTDAHGRSFFPTMRAALEIHRLADEPRPLVQFAFVGHYRPPLGLLGAAVDAVIGRRLAEATVHHFVKELRERVERELSSRGLGRYLVSSRDGPRQVTPR